MSEIAAYLAGLFDGEGCITVYEKKDTPTGKPRHGLNVQVRMANKPSIELFSKHYGTPVRDTPSRQSKHLLYTWTKSGSGAEAFLRDIQPYSVAKREVIDLALQFISTVSLTGALGSKGVSPEVLNLRQHIRKEIQRLNQLD